jgi:CubicO group peptidase (beta-lactamase class C family)
MTKLVCAVACMQLVERGDLTLDTDMRQHVPELNKVQVLRGFDANDNPVFEANDQPMTLRQLLTHSSGLTYDLADPRVLKYNETRNKSHSTILKTTKDALFDLPLTFAPGQSWAYGPGIEYAGLAVERITAQTLGDYMREHIFKPLRMNATTFHPLRLKEEMERQGCWGVDIPQRNEAGMLINWPGPEERAIPLEPEYESGGSGLYSCAEDYVKLIGALLRGGGPILKPETVDILLNPTLGDASRQTLQKGMWANPSGEYVKEMQFDYAPGGLVILRDNGDDMGRRAGTVRWSGMNHPIWVSAHAFIGLSKDMLT